jgi:heat-inducible transcriptional repressor
MATLLDDRSREVLKSLIQLHIATGEPVGSESLARSLNRSLSPATLRNIMSDLEKLGYLTHPHTSAGRMPTDEGYRVYVDSLMRQPLPARDALAIDSELRPRQGSSSEVLETASHLLSRLSRNVGFVVAPPWVAPPSGTSTWCVSSIPGCWWSWCRARASSPTR